MTEPTARAAVAVIHLAVDGVVAAGVGAVIGELVPEFVMCDPW